MQSTVTTTTVRPVEEYEARSRTLSEAAHGLVRKLVGCLQHDLSRPFRHHGKRYRVCFKCEKFLTVA